VTDNSSEAAVARLAGTASAVALLLAVGVTLALDRTVLALPVRARLSDLGRPGAPGAQVFDLGLVGAGVLGLVFAVALWRIADSAGDAEDRAVVAVAGAAFIGLVGAGTFPAPTTPHAPFLALAYLAGIATVLLEGLRRRSEQARAGTALVTVVLAVVALWGIRAVVGATFLLAGTGALLLAELATLAAFAGWVAFRARATDSPAGRETGVTVGER
jgi:hypothetical membrane protein